jgi:proteasome lid subunit RPN8/RPN11
MDRALILHDAERRRLAVWAAEAYPHEACGLMLGRRDGAAAEVVELRRARNANTGRARDRYEIDPADYLAAEEAAAHAGLEIVGIWHTHPDHPARPSATDLELAWAGWSYVIAAVTAGGMTELRSWRLDGSAFEEEEIRP